MTKQLAVLFGIFVVGWLGYMAWVTGYRTGYEEATDRAWQQIRRAVPAERDAVDIADGFELTLETSER